MRSIFGALLSAYSAGALSIMTVEYFTENNPYASMITGGLTLGALGATSYFALEKKYRKPSDEEPKENIRGRGW